MCSPQCGPLSFVIFNLRFILIYPIDLIFCINFVINGEVLTQLEDPYFFHYIFLRMLKFLFV